MKILRNLIGQILLFINWLTLPKKGARSPERQLQIEALLNNHSIYQFEACPFCVKVRRTLRRLNLPIELRDAQGNPEHRKSLKENGGKVRVPCLRIQNSGEDQWMYESNDIISYLEEQFPLK